MNNGTVLKARLIINQRQSLSGNFMGAPFSDITLYLPTPHTVGTPDYYEQTSLENFVSDLYVQKNEWIQASEDK